jgi:hypothetical protein
VDEDDDDVDLLALTKRRPSKACVRLTLDETEKSPADFPVCSLPPTLKRLIYSALAQAPDDELLATWRTDVVDTEEYEVADSVLDDNLSVWSEAP